MSENRPVEELQAHHDLARAKRMVELAAELSEKGKELATDARARLGKGPHYGAEYSAKEYAQLQGVGFKDLQVDYNGEIVEVEPGIE
jgi:hypothetical protein